jgi:hypothetical protein
MCRDAQKIYKNALSLPPIRAHRTVSVNIPEGGEALKFQPYTRKYSVGREPLQRSLPGVLKKINSIHMPNEFIIVVNSNWKIRFAV